ncbi:MAG: type III pantothenate kinase [Cyclobacteriaceae bacterium]
MNNCVIDWGNTLIKAGIFFNGELRERYEAPGAKELIDKLDFAHMHQLIISSVSHDPGVILSAMSKVKHKIVLEASTPLPFVNHYITKDTLGNDRKAAVAGAQEMFPGRSCLVIDVGTCITYDFVENGRDYRGGMISPGIHIRLKGMHTFTGRLPQINQVDEVPLWEGQTTRESMLSGVINGITMEIEGMINTSKSKKGDLQVIMTGGDRLFFESRVKEDIFVAPELVLIGLNAILEFNEK